MAEQNPPAKKISMSNTKQEMLKAYNALLQEVKAKKEAELKPEKKREEKKVQEVVRVADSLSSEGVVKGISNLKLEVGKMLTQISDGLEEEVVKYKEIQQAIQFKEKELQELYEIEQSAATLAALIEAQHLKREEFESAMARRKEELSQEIEMTHAAWEKEQEEHEAFVKALEAEEKKKRERDREEFKYAFEREQQLTKDKFQDEKNRLEKEIQAKTEQMEKELTEREKAIAERELELNELRKKAATFPKEMEIAVNNAVKDATEKIKIDAKSREELMKKEFDGERNVLTTRIESLEKTVAEQSQHIAKLSQQLEQAYQKVQDIALKAVEGSSNSKSFASLQHLMSEQTRKQSQEK